MYTKNFEHPTFKKCKLTNEGCQKKDKIQASFFFLNSITIKSNKIQSLSYVNG